MPIQTVTATPWRGERLWAITCYFNPCGYQRRLVNYRLFRRRLQAPLIAVELSFGDGFELGHDDADVMIQLRGRDVMWQKERLLNVALAYLPDECDQVVWLDCDVLFADDDWPKAASAALGRHPVIQVFERSWEVQRDADVENLLQGDLFSPCESLARAVGSGRVKPDVLLSPDKVKLGVRCGLAWGARREILSRHGIYDGCILGCGDGAVISASLGNFDDLVGYLLMNRRRADHFRAWAQPFFRVVRGDLGYCAGTVYHLWHGELADRHYLSRRVGFAQFDFDPARDLAHADNGCWRWNSPKPDMHDFVRDYFSRRKEDGNG